MLGQVELTDAICRDLFGIPLDVLRLVAKEDLQSGAHEFVDVCVTVVEVCGCVDVLVCGCMWMCVDVWECGSVGVDVWTCGRRVDVCKAKPPHAFHL